MDLMRRFTAGLAVVLACVAALNYIPGLTDARGLTFGVFKLNLFNDILHSSSAVWAGLAAYLSRSASVFFLRTFGVLYFLDGLMGLMIGSGYLDLGFLYYGIQNLPLMFKIAANTPHLALGGVAAFAGFVLEKRT